jgi:hypothetical protein
MTYDSWKLRSDRDEDQGYEPELEPTEEEQEIEFLDEQLQKSDNSI